MSNFVTVNQPFSRQSFSDTSEDLIFVDMS